MRFLRKLHIELTSSTSGYLSEEIEIWSWRRCLHPGVHCSITYTQQDTETTLVSMDRWMDKENVAYIYNALFSLKKGKPTACNNTHGIG